MPSYLIRLTNPDDPSDVRYLEWSTVVDAPVTYGLTREEIQAHIKEEYGQQGLRDLRARLERADAKGTSSWVDRSLKEAIAGNHAGENGEELDERGLWLRYVDGRPSDDSYS